MKSLVLLSALLLAPACAGDGVPSGAGLPEVEDALPAGGAVLKGRALFFESGNLPAGSSTATRYLFDFDAELLLGEVEVTMLDGEGRVLPPRMDNAITAVQVLGLRGAGRRTESEGVRASVPLAAISGPFRVVVDATADVPQVRFAMVFKRAAHR